MADVPSCPPSHSPPSSSLSQNNNLAMLYYSLVVVAAAALILAIYNFLIVKRCARRSAQRQSPPANSGSIQTQTSQSSQLSSRNLIESSSFKYNKEANSNGDVNKNKASGDYEHECSVCLSVFEEGEEVRKLPRCNHSFHAPCIDMWLYSHHDCPLCRAIVQTATATPPTPPRRNIIEMVGVL